VIKVPQFLDKICFSYYILKTRQHPHALHAPLVQLQHQQTESKRDSEKKVGLHCTEYQHVNNQLDGFYNNINDDFHRFIFNNHSFCLSP